MAYLVALGISLAEPRKPIFTPTFCRDLFARASQIKQIGHAIEYLRQDVSRKRRKQATFNLNRYPRRKP